MLESIKQRHKLETEREIAPLRQAEDAIYIDSSNMTIEEVVDKIVSIINEKNYIPKTLPSMGKFFEKTSDSCEQLKLN